MSDSQQTLNIATYFLMSSPPGEVDDVLADVKVLVDNPETLDESTIAAILREYNTDQLLPVPELVDRRPILISKFSQVSSNEYVDPQTGKVFEFDHAKRTFTSTTDKVQQLPAEIESYRAALATALTAYTSASYRANKAVPAVFGADNGTLTACISARNVNLSNFWTGSWRAVYSLNVSSTGSTELKGTVRIHVHYFEDGNVQLNGSSELNTTVSIDASSESVAKRVVDTIAKFETEYQNTLEEMYVNMHRTTFKAMRRFLPVSKQKFLWNSAAHALAGDIGK